MAGAKMHIKAVRFHGNACNVYTDFILEYLNDVDDMTSIKVHISKGE